MTPTDQMSAFSVYPAPERTTSGATEYAVPQHPCMYSPRRYLRGRGEFVGEWEY